MTSPNPLQLFSMLTSACLIAGALWVWVSWRLAGRYLEPRSRGSARLATGVLLILMAFLCGRGFVLEAFKTRETGTWECMRCGAEREEIRYLERTLFVDDRLALREFATGHGGASCGDGEHAWGPTGCHFQGNLIFCYF